MVWELTRKVVVITGGIEGIGYDIANKFLKKNAKIVILLDSNEKNGSKAVEELTKSYGKNKAIFLRCDITANTDTVLKEVLQSYNVDVLVNSIGIADETRPKQLIDTNLTSLIKCSLILYNHMRQDKGGNGGTIINISSIFGLMSSPVGPVYQASRHGALAFTKSLGHFVNFVRSGVRVVAICPGFTEIKLLTTVQLWDSTLNNVYAGMRKSFPSQEVDVVGNAAVEIFERASSGTLWKIEDSQPIVDVTNMAILTL